MVTESVEDKAGVDVEADRRSRWSLCLHEAAHAVAGRVLLKITTKAMVFGDCGSTICSGGVPASLKEAMVAAAGIMGDVLAIVYQPPKEAPGPPAHVVDPQTESIRVANGTGMSDREAVARWCILGHEAKPKTWANRHEWVFSSTQEFVLDHRHEIIETATALFSCGIITLPAKPEEGSLHVDRVENAGS